jgi:hypothetical protein
MKEFEEILGNRLESLMTFNHKYTNTVMDRRFNLISGLLSY